MTRNKRGRRGKAQKLADRRSESGRRVEGAGGSGSAERSRVVGAGVLQVVELQLQLAYPHVLGGQLILQPPQLVLLPEEHPQELEVEEAGKGHFGWSRGGGSSVRLSQETRHLGNKQDYWGCLLV